MRSVALALLLACQAFAQTTYYVDPNTGVDRPAGGGATNPLKTLTYAAALAGPAGPANFFLRPGTYGAASGETFPIALPDTCTVESDPALVPAGARLAKFTTTLALATTFSITPAGNSVVLLRNLQLGGGQYRGVQLNVSGLAAQAVLVVEDCGITQSRCVAINATSAMAVASVRILRSDLNGPDTSLIVNTQPGATCNLTIERSTVSGGLTAGIELDAALGGTINLGMVASYLLGSQKAGLAARTGAGGVVTTRIEHCAVWGVGLKVIGGGSGIGAIVDTVGGGGTAPVHTILNSLLANNKADAPGGTAPTYTWGKNLVTQASLAGRGGNVLGAPTFVDTSKGDFHLAPGSAGIDLGDPLAVTTNQDRDGEPRLGPFCGAAPDLGPDEHFAGAVFSADDALPGQGYRLRVTSGPNVAFAVVLGTARVPASFGPGAVHLAGQVYDLGLAGATGTNGVGLTTLSIPPDAALTGLVVYWQGLFAQAPYLGTNAWRTVVGN